MNTATPTAAELLIDTLQPKQSAILYTALLFFKSEAENNHATHIENNKMAPTLQRRISEYLRWNLKETRELTNLLFADCFPEDLEPLQYFAKDLPILKEKPILDSVG